MFELYIKPTFGNSLEEYNKEDSSILLYAETANGDLVVYRYGHLVRDITTVNFARYARTTDVRTIYFNSFLYNQETVLRLLKTEKYTLNLEPFITLGDLPSSSYLVISFVQNKYVVLKKQEDGILFDNISELVSHLYKRGVNTLYYDQSYLNKEELEPLINTEVTALNSVFENEQLPNTDSKKDLVDVYPQNQIKPLYVNDLTDNWLRISDTTTREQSRRIEYDELTSILLKEPRVVIFPRGISEHYKSMLYNAIPSSELGFIAQSSICTLGKSCFLIERLTNTGHTCQSSTKKEVDLIDLFVTSHSSTHLYVGDLTSAGYPIIGTKVMSLKELRVLLDTTTVYINLARGLNVFKFINALLSAQ